MKYLITLFGILLMSCQKEKPILVEKKREIISYDKATYIIEDFRKFEIEQNKEFQKSLVAKSNSYFENITKEFIEKEYGVSGSFSEMLSLAEKINEIGDNQSPDEELDKRFYIWQSKINNYYSSVAYARFIKSQTDIYNKGVNNQRKKELDDLLNLMNSDTLSIKNVELDAFRASKKLVNESITTANKKMLENFIGVTTDGISIATILVTAPNLATYELISTAGIQGVKIFVPSEKETVRLLKSEYSNFISKNNIDFSEVLNTNTNNYYDKLLFKINERKNKKILL